MSAHARAGATCLVLAPIAGCASVAIGATVSSKAADQAKAFVEHPAATHVGLGLNAVAAALLIGGIVWFAWVTYPRSPRLAVVGGALGVFGMLAAVFDVAVHASGSLVVAGMNTTQATTALGPLTSGGIVASGPLSELADVGLILLAVAALRLGLPRWGTAVICVGAIGEGLGFAVGSRYLAAAGFAVTAVGLATVVRTVHVGAPTPAVAAPVPQHV